MSRAWPSRGKIPQSADAKPDHSSIASTIGKAAIVIFVTFSVPLQIHPCRASLDAILKWRPRNSSSGADSPSAGGGVRPLLPGNASVASSLDCHGSPVSHMSDMRFALLTTIIVVCSYATALSVSSLDRVLAYVGSTGSTSISFILPGLFYYKISDPEGVHHQRLAKENDDVGDSVSHVSSDGDEALAGSGFPASIASLQSGASRVSGGSRWRWRRKFRWDLEHLEHDMLRTLALGLSVYGVVIMVVCLVMNTFVAVAH